MDEARNTKQNGTELNGTEPKGTQPKGTGQEKPEQNTNEQKIITRLKICIAIGICLLLIGHYIISYSGLVESMGVTAMILGASCMALGLIFSLPTKMYLTFLLVKRENDKDKKL